LRAACNVRKPSTVCLYCLHFPGSETIQTKGSPIAIALPSQVTPKCFRSARPSSPAEGRSNAASLGFGAGDIVDRAIDAHQAESSVEYPGRVRLGHRTNNAGGWIGWIGDQDSQEAPLVRTPRRLLTLRRMAVAVAAVVLVLACLRWLLYPHVNVTVFNESSTAIRDVRLRFLYGERTAERIEPGGFAATEIQSGGESGVFISYRDSSGILIKDQPLYYSDSTASPDRGFVEMHVTDEGTRVDRQIYNFDWFAIPILTVRVRPTGRMTVQ
jgi:hypothetical protein